jgi:hypothetical protein
MSLFLRITMMGAVLGGAGAMATMSGPVAAQSSPNAAAAGFAGRPQVGGTYQPRVTPEIPVTGTGTEAQRHKDFSGKPCMAVSGFARPFVANPKLFDHVVNAENGCPNAIRLQVCYLLATGCVAMEVPGYGRKEAILGTMPSQKDFRFQFVEKF